MPQDELSQQARARKELFGTHQGLFYLLGVGPALHGRDSTPQPRPRPSADLGSAQAALTRAAMADMFCFKNG